MLCYTPQILEQYAKELNLCLWGTSASCQQLARKGDLTCHETSLPNMAMLNADIQALESDILLAATWRE